MKLYTADTSKQAKLASALPTPSGYRILLALPEVKEKTDGNIILTEKHRNDEQVASVVGFVVKIGPDAYKDTAKFPNGPWCKEGDWVICRTYSGTRIRIHGKEFRFVNDDTIDGIIEDPRGVERA